MRTVPPPSPSAGGWCWMTLTGGWCPRWAGVAGHTGQRVVLLHKRCCACAAAMSELACALPLSLSRKRASLPPFLLPSLLLPSLLHSTAAPLPPPQEVGTRNNVQCLEKWYTQLSPSMVARGEWGSGDDRRLLRSLYLRWVRHHQECC
jgi:hypothetical protein